MEFHLQGKLEDILVEVVFNDSEVFCFFSCAPDRLFGEHFGLFPNALEARSFAPQISNLSSLKADTAHLVISYEGPDELNGFEGRRCR